MKLREVVFAPQLPPPLKEIAASHICNRRTKISIYMKSAAVDTKWQDVGRNPCDDEEQITQVKFRPKREREDFDFLFWLDQAFTFRLN